jgi:hypothetical protein
MKKITLTLALLSSVILLSACGWKDKSNDVVAVEVDTCDTYVEYLRCVADNLGDQWLATKKALDQTVESRKSYTADELRPICEGAIEGLKKVEAMYAEFDCQLEPSGTEEDTAPIASWNVDEETE